MDQPKVRMDRSRDYATVHGERVPNDRHAAVFFYQDEMPFDADGFLIPDHPDFEPGVDQPSAKARKLRALADKKMAKAAKVKARSAPPLEAADPDAHASGEVESDEDDDDEDGPKEINLEAWARGEPANWNDVTQTIARRYKKRVNNKADAIELLVEEKVVSLDQLAPAYRKLMN